MKLLRKREGKLKLTMKGKDAVAGYLFILPFLIGFFTIFLVMIVESISFSFSNMEVGVDGYILHKAANGGLEHYKRALTIDPNFNLELINSIVDMLVSVPLILIFSLFAANMLNQKFPGRALARSIFFLPVIITSGIVLGVEQSNILLTSTTASGEVMDSTSVENFLSMSNFLLNYTDLSRGAISFLSNAVDGIYDIVIASGVQILIFLAGLQSISPSLYEAADVEGSTGWEKFWKITFPMISPLILVNAVYTIIDSFTKEGNIMMDNISNTIFNQIQYGYGSAMAWIYFVVISLILILVGGLVSKKVFYND